MEKAVSFTFLPSTGRKAPMIIFGDGTQTRDFISVHDVVSANLAALTQGSGAVVNICTQEETSLNDLTRMMSEITGSSQLSPGQPPGKAIFTVPVCPGRSHSALLHWAPSVSLLHGGAGNL